jgi:NAD+ synthase (glutamine-hydrolysing)
MKVGLAQVNPVVGDLRANSAKIGAFVERAKHAGAELVVFPELALVGYPPKDLLLKPSFVADNLAALEIVARQCVGITAVVGYVDRNESPVGRPLRNAVAVCEGGRVRSRHFKTLLPTYDVFDESRYFEPVKPGPGQTSNVVAIGGGKVGLSICEDLWNDERLIARRLYHENPIHDLHQAGADLLVNASASPFYVGKHDFRLELFGQQAKSVGKPLVYVNQVGGNDELLFDGASCVFDAAGRCIAQAKDFEEDLLVVDLSATAHTVHPHRTGLESLHAALLLGLRDYVGKCGFKSVVLGLSGGIDSALTAALAAEALGPDRVVGVAMPSRYSSDHSVEDARRLAENLGIGFHLVPIGTMHDAYEAALTGLFTANGNGTPLGDDLTEQNLQARVRGATLMAFSNRYNHLLLTTGNKSEVATGYCTLYGDMCGGLAVISDVPKTTVWELSRFHNRKHGRELIPVRSIDKVPSAELRPNQTDQDSLPPYDLLDAILHRYIEEEKGSAEIVGEGFDEAVVRRVIRLVDRSEYKRRQAAPGLKVTSRAFGFGRRMPIAMNYTA